MANLNDIFGWFSIGRTPTADQFKQSWSSFWHKSEKLPISQVFGLQEEIAKATTNFKGYHTSLADLLIAYPQVENKKDFFAWVGSPYPGTVYVVKENGGEWTNTGEVPTQQEIDLAEYAKKTDLNIKADITLSSGANVIYANQSGSGSYLDLTSDSKNHIKAGIGLKTGNGVYLSWNGGTIVSKYKLEPNEDYVITGLNNPKLSEPIAWLYSSDVQSENGKIGLKNNGNGKVTFSTDSINIYISFYIKIESDSEPSIAFNSIDTFRLIKGNQAKTVITSNGVTIIPNSEELLYRRVMPLEDKDITSQVKNTTLSKVGLNYDGLLSTFSGGTIINRYKLKESSKYEITGLGFNPELVPGEAILYLYSSNNQSEKATSSISITKQYDKIVFTTGSEPAFMSFYIIVEGAPNGNNFNSMGSLSVIEKSSEISIVDKEGKQISGTSGGLSSFKDIEEESVLVDWSAHIKNPMSINDPVDMSNEGVVNPSDNPNLPNTQCIFRLPLDKGYWYYIDYGVDTKGTVYAHIHDTLDNVKSIFFFPVCPKNQVYVSDDSFKYLTMYLSCNYSRRGIAFDASSSLKITKVKKAQKGFEASGGFLDLKSIKGIMDLSDRENPNIPYPQSIAYYAEWGSNKGISRDDRVEKQFDLWVDSVYLSGISKTAYQGNSSFYYPFKNTKHKFVNSKGEKIKMKIDDNIRLDSFHMKSCYVDVTNSKIMLVPKLFGMIWATREDGLIYPYSTPYSSTEIEIAERFDTGAKCHTKGIPVLYYDNGAFIGLKSLISPVDRDAFNMSKKNKNHLIYRCDFGQKMNNPNDKTLWEEGNRDNAGNDIPDEDFEAMKNFITWLNSTKNFKEEASEWMDVLSFIHYYLITYYVFGMDSWGNNFGMVTYNNKKMYICPHDWDNSFGAMLQLLYPATTEFATKLKGNSTEWVTPQTSVLWSRLEKYFMPEIKTEYKRLKELDLLSPKGLKKLFDDYSKNIPFEAYRDTTLNFRQILSNRPEYSDPDEGRATSIGNNIGGYYGSFKQIKAWIDERFPFMESKFGN